jgi:predicted CXXCH cytochrome family protein
MSATLYRVAIPIVLAVLLVPIGWGFLSGWERLGQPVDLREVPFVGSDACADCHRDRHESWAATFHRTMTQEAGPHSVQGRFDGQDLDYLGLRVRPVEQNGRHYFEYHDLDSGEMIQRIAVDRTVGSNRYQQYLTRLPDDGTYVRLHYLWHNGDQRWVHMNAAFLGTDGRPFDSHVAIWNQNCIFCHNTGPRPGILNYERMRQQAALGVPVDSTRDARFDSTVAELGIACETCHGPGGEHAARARQFWPRMALRVWPERDASIVNPVRLDATRATHVCAQCHAQRVPPDAQALRTWMRDGPTYRPGFDLNAHAEPVFRSTRVPVAGQEDLFRLRFWDDDTPRLSAYEYQGLALSACYQEAALACTDCHTMHAGDPAGQLTDRNRGNAPCLRCHQEYRKEASLASHSRHATDGSASLCYNCHMPHLNYGVMAIHRSHRIEVPDARRDATAGRPNACLNCHGDESTAWAVQELAAWNAIDREAPAPQRADGVPASISDLATVLAGDPVQKSVAAWRAGHPDSATRGADRGWMAAFLLEAMDDVYPATRRFASQSFARILEDWPRPDEVAETRQHLSRFDFVADADPRRLQLAAVLDAWRRIDKRAWPPPPPQSGVADDFSLPRDLRDTLVELGRRQDKQISIGE